MRSNANIKNIIRHENYNASVLDFDFALIKLDAPLKFTDCIQAIALPDADTVIEDGIESQVTGWGNEV